MVKRCEMHNRELDELEAAGKDPDESIQRGVVDSTLLLQTISRRRNSRSFCKSVSS